MFESLCLGRMLWCESRASICFVGGLVVCADRVIVVAVRSNSVKIKFLIVSNCLCYLLRCKGSDISTAAQSPLCGIFVV